MNKTVLVLAAGVMATGVFAGQLWQELRAVRVQSVALRERIASIQSAQLVAALPAAQPEAAATGATAVVPGAGTQVQALTGDQAQGASSPAVDAAQDGVTAPAKADAAQATGNKPGSALMEGLTKFMSTPAGRDMIQMQARMALPRMYPDLAKELGLTPAQEEQFFDMLVRQQVDASADALGALGGNGLDRAAIQELQRKAQDAQRASQAEIAGFLGDKTPAWQEYQRTLPLRRQVNQLQEELGPTNALSEAQKKSVISTLAAEQTRINEERRNAPRPTAAAAPITAQNVVEVQMQREAESNQRMVDAASAHMNAEQSEAFRRLLEQQQELARSVIRSIQP